MYLALFGLGGWIWVAEGCNFGVACMSEGIQTLKKRCYVHQDQKPRSTASYHLGILATVHPRKYWSQVVIG